MTPHTPHRRRTKTNEIPASIHHALVEMRELNKGLDRIASSMETVGDEDPEWRQRALVARGYLERRYEFLFDWLLQTQDDVSLLAVACVLIEKLHSDVEGGLESRELIVLHRLKMRFPMTVHIGA